MGCHTSKQDERNLISKIGDGDPILQCKLAELYITCRELNKTQTDVIRLLEASALQGNSRACSHLGHIYCYGIVPHFFKGMSFMSLKDIQIAYKWFLLATDHGNIIHSRDVDRLRIKLRQKRFSEGTMKLNHDIKTLNDDICRTDLHHCQTI